VFEQKKLSSLKQPFYTLAMEPMSGSIPLTDITRKKKRPIDLEAQVKQLG